MDEILQFALQLAPVFQALTLGEAAIGVTDRNTIVYYSPGKKLDIGVRSGQPIGEKGPMREAMNAGGLTNKVLPAELFGFRFRIVGTALRDSTGEVIGAFMTGFPLTLEDELGKMAASLATAVQRFAATFGDIKHIAGDSGQAATSVEKTANQVSGMLENTGGMTTLITRIADKTRLLGLNASIEAAHAGKAGTGFAVVAREIQALSAQSIKAAQEVNAMLGGLNGQTAGLTEAVDLLRAGSERLQTALGAATDNVDRLAGMAETLQHLATRTETEQTATDA